MASMLTPGRVIIILGNLSYAIGAFIADWNVTHIYNPRWPPHAKFHNGQTMSMGICLAAVSIYFLLRPTSRNSKTSAKDAAFDAALVGSLYHTAGLTAILYPGTDWFDPEYAHVGIQKFLFPSVIALQWLGYLLEVRRLSKGKVA